MLQQFLLTIKYSQIFNTGQIGKYFPLAHICPYVEDVRAQQNIQLHNLEIIKIYITSFWIKFAFPTIVIQICFTF